MSLPVFDAITAEFNRDPQLKKYARRVYWGFAGNRLKGGLPYIEVHRIGGGTVDTFDSDGEEMLLQFSLFDKSSNLKQIHQMVELVIDTFDSASLQPPKGELIHNLTERTNLTGPQIIDGVYQATIDYRMIFTRRTKTPKERG